MSFVYSIVRFEIKLKSVSVEKPPCYRRLIERNDKSDAKWERNEN